MSRLALLLLFLVPQQNGYEKAIAEVDKDFAGSVLVAVKGKVVFEKGFGLADAATGRKIGTDALYDWASLSKQFTAAAVLKLQDLKRLTLDDPLSKYFKDAPADKAKVTLRQLLNHTSGIEAGFGNGEHWNFDSSQRDAFEKMFLKLPMTSKPGEKWEYSNSAYAMLAAIVEHLTGKSFEDFCIENLFRPFGMKDATFIGGPGLDAKRVPKINKGVGFDDEPKDRAFAYGDRLHWAYRGCGGVVATPRDLYNWDLALRGEKLLSKAAKAELYKVGMNNFALGWVVRTMPEGLRVEHGGNVRGLATYMLRMIDENITILVVCSYEPRQNAVPFAEALLPVARKAK